MANHSIQIPEPRATRFLFADTRMAWLWLLVRLYVGWAWLMAGWEKVHDPAWVGPGAGSALHGFIAGALQKSGGPHPDVSGWYATFLNNVASPHAATFAQIVAYGELFVGVALIIGLFTGIAAFFGAFMNVNYLFAGTVSTNPLLLVLEVLLVLAWRIAGWYGVDHLLLARLGTPWQPGEAFTRLRPEAPPAPRRAVS